MIKRLFVCALLVGCGGDDSGGGGGGTVALDDLGLQLATASCTKQFECCTDAEIMQQYMGITYEGQPITTQDQCIAFGNAVLTSIAVAQYKDSLAMGRVEYDGAAAGACIAAIEGLTCSEYSTGSSSVPSGCRPFVIPKVADGGACRQDYECTSHNCEGATVQPGGPNTDGACKPMPAAGQACMDSCADGLYCGFDQSTSMEVCQPLKANGAQCTRRDECTSDYCDGATHACAMKPLTCDGL